MKKIIVFPISIAMLIILFILIHAPVQVYGADSNTSTGIEQQDGITQIGPPWYDPAWNYRRAVFVTNNGSFQNYYQVLVKLTISNFDFTKAKPDGSDIRFTGIDGTTELSYWIESWQNPDPQVAYIWIRIFPLLVGTNTIYLYYNNNNLSVVSHSNGTTTFDGFDDNWSNITGMSLQQEIKQRIDANGVDSQLTWMKISGTPTVAAGILSLGDGSGIKSNLLPPYLAVGYRANFGLGNGKEWGGFIDGASGPYTMIGDLQSDKDDMYLRDSRTSSEDIGLPRVSGNDWHNSYHIYEVRWKDGQSIGDIDHGTSTKPSTQSLAVPNTYLPVTFYSYSGSNATLSVDWVYVRQYRDPEPTALVGSEQGLVDLSVSVEDSPDPVNTRSELTYVITIFNNSNIDAPGVVVTDTLPLSVQFLWASSSLGCTNSSNIVVCNLAPIAANSSANATIVVKPLTDGIITDSAMVFSAAYDINLSNNFYEQTTTVDTVAPTVEWVPPFINRQLYDVYGGPITLTVEAKDNIGIQRVEFKWYDGSSWHLIETVFSPIAPSLYQIIFSSEILNPNVYNPIEVYAFDLARNVNDLSDEKRQIIYIKLISLKFTYIPLVQK